MNNRNWWILFNKQKVQTNKKCIYIYSNKYHNIDNVRSCVYIFGHYHSQPLSEVIIKKWLRNK